MERFAREDVRAVLADFEIGSARRAADVDATEEVILLTSEAYAKTDVATLINALMAVLPHIKVWVVEDGPRWLSEPI